MIIFCLSCLLLSLFESCTNACDHRLLRLSLVDLSWIMPMHKCHVASVTPYVLLIDGIHISDMYYSSEYVCNVFMLNHARIYEFTMSRSVIYIYASMFWFITANICLAPDIVVPGCVHMCLAFCYVLLELVKILIFPPNWLMGSFVPPSEKMPRPHTQVTLINQIAETTNCLGLSNQMYPCNQVLL